MWKLLFWSLPLFSFWVPEPSIEIQLSFSEIRKASGELRLAVCRDAAEFPYQPFRSVVIPKADYLSGHQLTFRLELPPGTYAIAVLDDENGNGELDSNWMGIPQEGFAFSNNIKPTLTGPPSFQACKIDLTHSAAQARVKLLYWGGE